MHHIESLDEMRATRKFSALLLTIGIAAGICGLMMIIESRLPVIVDVATPVIEAAAFGPDVFVTAELVNRSNQDVRVLGSCGTCGPAGCEGLLSPECPFTIPSHGCRTIELTYAPKTSGRHVKQLKLFLDAPSQPLLEVEVHSHVREAAQTASTSPISDR
jgi:hypothetical protein